MSLHVLLHFILILKVTKPSQTDSSALSQGKKKKKKKYQARTWYGIKDWTRALKIVEVLAYTYHNIMNVILDTFEKDLIYIYLYTNYIIFFEVFVG